MAEDTVVTNIVARSDFSDLIGDLTKVSSRLSILQSQLTTTNRALANQAAQMQKSFANTLRSTGQFSTHFVSLQSDVDKFGRTLDSGKMKLGQYYGAWKEHSRTAGGLIRDLAKQQVMMQNAVLQPLGKNSQGLMQFNVHVPQGLDEVANKTKIASQEMKIMNKVIQDGANQVINWGKNTQWAGRQLTMGLTLPIVAFGAAAQKAFLEADQELVRLTKVYGGVAQTSAADLKKVRAEVSATARELAAAYGASYKDSIALAADIAATGKQGNELLKSTAETTRLSILGEVDRQEAMKATLAIQTAFKQNTTELGESINFLNAVENQTSTSLQDLVEAIPKAGPVIQAMGGSIKDLALYMTAMKEGGINASEGANAIKSALASLINPTKVAKEMFSGFGIDLGGIVTKNAGNLTGTILELQGALDKLDPLQKQQAIEQLFGKFQFARMNALFSNLGKQGSQTLQVLDLMKASSKDLADVASREMTAMTESASGKYKRALETLKADMAGVGDQFLTVSTKLINVIDGIIKFFNNLPKPLKSVVTFVAGLTAIAGPIIMLTGLLANFFGYIAKGIFHFKAFLKGGEGFKLLTPEILAAEKAGSLMEQTFFSDAKAASVLQKAIANLTAELSLLETKANSATVAVGPAIQTAAGAPLRGMAGSEVVVNKNHPLVGQPFTRQMAHFIPAKQEQPGTIFGVVPNPGPVNQKISNNLQMYANSNMPAVAGLSSIRGVNTGVIPAEAAKWHAMTGALAMQSKTEIAQLKAEVAATQTITSSLSDSYQALLPEMTRLTSRAADESAIIVGELQAGKITVDAARRKIAILNAEIETMMGQAATSVAAAQGRAISLTTVPLTGQPAVTATGKSNMKELFHKGPTASLVDTVARNLGVRTSGAGYSRETTFPRVTVAPFLRRNKGGNVYDPRKHGAVVPGDTSINYDNTPAVLPLNGFVLNQRASLNPKNQDIVALANGGMTSGTSNVPAIVTPGETVYTPEVLSANPGLRETLVRVNNGYAYGGNIQKSKNNYGPLNNYTLSLLSNYMARASKIGGLRYSNAGRTYISSTTGKPKTPGTTTLSDFEAGSGSISYKKAQSRSSTLYSEQENIAHGITPTISGQVLGHAWTPQVIRRLRDITGIKDVSPLTNLSRQQLIDIGMSPKAVKEFYRALPTSWVKIPERFNQYLKADAVPASTWGPNAPRFTADDMQSLRIFSKDSGKHPIETQALAEAAAAKLNLLMHQRMVRGQNMSEEVFGKLVNTAHISAIRTAGAPSQDPAIRMQKIISKWPATNPAYQVNRFANLANTDPHAGPLFIGNAKSISGDLTGEVGKKIYYNDKFGNISIGQGLPSGTPEEVARYITRRYMAGDKTIMDRMAREREQGLNSHPLSIQSLLKPASKKFTGNLFRGISSSRLEDSFPKNIADAIKLARETGDVSSLLNKEFILRRSSFSEDPDVAKFFTAFKKDGIVLHASVLNRNVTPVSEMFPDVKFPAPAGQSWAQNSGGTRSEQESLLGGKFKIVDFKDGVLKVQSVTGIEPREKGGPVNAGKPYLVGERGPELFVPKNAGGIVSNYALGGIIKATQMAYGAQDPSVNLNTFTEETARKALKSGNPARAAQAQMWLMQYGRKSIPANGGVPVSKYDPAFVPGKTRGSGTGGAGFTDWQMRGSQRGSFPSFYQPPTVRSLYGEAKGIASDATLKAAARMQLQQIAAINGLLKAQTKAVDTYYKTGIAITKFQSQLRTDVFGAHGLVSRSQNTPSNFKELFGSSRGFGAAFAPRLDANGRPIAGTRMGLSSVTGNASNPFTKSPMLTSIAATAATAYAGQKVAEKNPMLGNMISSVGSMAAFMLPQYLMGRAGKSVGAQATAMAMEKGISVQAAKAAINEEKQIAKLLSKGAASTADEAKAIVQAGGKASQVGRFGKTASVALNVGSKIKAIPGLLVLAQLNPYVRLAQIVATIGQGLWVWKRHSEDIGKANRAVFGPTAKSLQEVGIKYVSINDKLKAYHKQLILTREAAASSFKDKDGKTIQGLTLNQSQVEAGVIDAKKNAKETVQDFNKTYGQKDVVALAASLKQQYVSAGMSIQEATNKIYIMMKASNKGGMAMAAISSKAFKSITDSGTAADYAMKLVTNAMRAGKVNAEELSTGINNVMNSLDQFRTSVIGTKDKDGNVIDENEALRLTLEKIKNNKASQVKLDKDALENLKSQNIELAAILGKNETLASVYAKIALSQSPIATYANPIGLKPGEAVEVASGLQGYMSTISKKIDNEGIFSNLDETAKSLGNSYDNLTKAAKSFSTVKYDKVISAQQEIIKAINKELETRLKILDAQEKSEDFASNLKKEQLAYQNALATGDMAGAAMAQINIQKLVKDNQRELAKQALKDQAQAKVDTANAKIDKANTSKSKAEEGAQNAQTQATNAQTQQLGLLNFNSTLTNLIAQYPISKTPDKVQKESITSQLQDALKALRETGGEGKKAADKFLADYSTADKQIAYIKDLAIGRDGKGGALADAKASSIFGDAVKAFAAAVAAMPGAGILGSRTNAITVGANQQQSIFGANFNVSQAAKSWSKTTGVPTGAGSLNPAAMAVSDRRVVRDWARQQDWFAVGVYFQIPDKDGNLIKFKVTDDNNIIKVAKATGGTVNGYAAGGRQNGTYVPGMGGYVRGAGTPTSDSILTQMGSGGLVRLSDTEYVQPASTVAYYGTHFMDLVRSRSIPKRMVDTLVGESPEQGIESNYYKNKKFRGDSNSNLYIPRTNIIPDSREFSEYMNLATGGTVNGYAAGGKAKDGWLQKWAKNISGQPAAEMFGTAQLLRLVAGLGQKGDNLGAAQVPLAFLGSGIGPKIAGNLGKTAFAIPNKLYQLRNQAKVNSMIKSGMWHGSQPTGLRGEEYLQGTNILTGPESHDPYYGMGFFSTTSKSEADLYASGYNSLSNWGESMGSLNQVVHAPKGKYIDFTKKAGSLKWQDYALSKALGAKKNSYMGSLMPENLGDIMNAEGMTGAIMKRISMGRSPLDKENPMWLSWSNPAGVITKEKYAMGGAIPGYSWGGLDTIGRGIKSLWNKFKDSKGGDPLVHGITVDTLNQLGTIAQFEAHKAGIAPSPTKSQVTSLAESTSIPSFYRVATNKKNEGPLGKTNPDAQRFADLAGVFGFFTPSGRSARAATAAAKVEAERLVIEAAKPENVAARIKAEIAASFDSSHWSTLPKGKAIKPGQRRNGWTYSTGEDFRFSRITPEEKLAENLRNSKINALRAKMKATPWAMTSEELSFLYKSGKVNQNYLAPILPNEQGITSAINTFRSANKLSVLDPRGFDTTSNLYGSNKSLQDLLDSTLYHGGQLPENDKGSIMFDPDKSNPNNWFGAPFFATEGKNQALSYLIKNLSENPSIYKIKSNLKPEEVLDLRHGADPLSKQNPFILARIIAELRRGDYLRAKPGSEYWTRYKISDWLVAQENGEDAALLAPQVNRLKPFLQIEGLAPFLKHEGIKAIAHRGGSVLRTPDIFGKDMFPFKYPGRTNLEKSSNLVKGDTSAQGHDVLAYTTMKDTVASIEKSTITRQNLSRILQSMDNRGATRYEIEEVVDQILSRSKGKGFNTTYAIGGSLSSLNIPKFEKGINSVPVDMMAMLHKNEAVVPANMNPFNPNANGNFGGERVYTIAPVIHAAPGMDENAIADIATRKMLDQLKRIQYNEARANGMGRSF